MGAGTEAAQARERKFPDGLPPGVLLEGIREDFEERQYLWSGDIDPELYDENCVFTDPTLSFKGLRTFERNIENLRPILDRLLPEESRRCVLHKLEPDGGSGKISAEWTMIGDLALPWGPRIQLSGRTSYTPGADGRIVSYDENWDISAAEALGQLVTPKAWASEGIEHWPGSLTGAAPPTPAVVLSEARTFVVLPGFGNDAVDYVEPLGQSRAVGLQECLARRGCKAVVSPVGRLDWLQVFARGLLDSDFLAGNGTAPVAFGWYLDRARDVVEEAVRTSGRPIVLLGHSAGGWLARALMRREGAEWVKKHVEGMVSLGSPHLPPPESQADMTRGCLRDLDQAHPGAFFSDMIFYITVAGDAVQGEQIKGNVPILELIQSPSPESTAFNSYKAVCGKGVSTGDGVVPLSSAHLDGATQLTIDGCLHSINVAGTVRPTNSSYLCEAMVDKWLRATVKELVSRGALREDGPAVAA